MQRASQERTASRVTTASLPTGRPLRSAGRTLKAASSAAAVDAERISEVTPPTAKSFTKVPIEASERSERARQLAITIRQRIETRLPGRVRDLVVTLDDNTVVLKGRCATYYTKQLAQHAALGILDDEQLENLIVVSVPK